MSSLKPSTASSQKFDASCAAAKALPDKPVGGGKLPCQQGPDRCAPCRDNGYEDPTAAILCEIFCKVKCEGEDFKAEQDEKIKQGKLDPKDKQKFDFSKRAKELGKDYAAQGKLPKSIEFEKRVLVPIKDSKFVKKLSDAGRKVWTHSEIRNKLITEIGGKALARTVRRKAKTIWMKAVPGLNVLSTVVDIVDMGVLAYDIGMEVQNALVRYTGAHGAVEAIPDVVQMDPNGQIDKIYDYKFEGDSFRNEQEQLYREANQGADIGEVSQGTCDCGCRNPKKQVASAG